MKTSSITPLLGVLALAVASPVSVNAQSAGLPAKVPAPAELPLNLRCVVVVDPEHKSGETAEQSPKGGFTGPNMLEGVVIRMDQEWLVLKDGSFENWIPREKILTVRVSR